jgi:hypoxanthine phosphoribosyltransferase
MNVLLNPRQIRTGILKISETLLMRHSQSEPIVMIGVMRGGFMFYTDLIHELQNLNIICDFVTCTSYTGTENTGFKMLQDSKVDVKDRHVYLVDDILDSGLTYEYLKVHYDYKEAKSVEGIFALKKYNEKYKKEMCIMSISNEDYWYVGYGMDDENGGSRHLKSIYYK